MNTDLLAFVLARLRARRPHWRDVARDSGVPFDTVKKIASGVTRNPGVLHVQRLADFFAALDAGTPVDGERCIATSPGTVPAADPAVWPLPTERRGPGRPAALPVEPRPVLAFDGDDRGLRDAA